MYLPNTPQSSAEAGCQLIRHTKESCWEQAQTAFLASNSALSWPCACACAEARPRQLNALPPRPRCPFLLMQAKGCAWTRVLFRSCCLEWTQHAILRPFLCAVTESALRFPLREMQRTCVGRVISKVSLSSILVFRKLTFGTSCAHNA